MNITNRSLKNTLLCVLFFLSLVLSACDDPSYSYAPIEDEQSEDAEVSQPELVGPDLNGDDWAGYYKSVNGNFELMTATIEHVGNSVTIQTSKASGVASSLYGTIDSFGNMMLYDDFDNEDWTTHYGPATNDSINLADYVFKDTSKVDTNIIILKR